MVWHDQKHRSDFAVLPTQFCLGSCRCCKAVLCQSVAGRVIHLVYCKTRCSSVGGTFCEEQRRWCWTFAGLQPAGISARLSCLYFNFCRRCPSITCKVALVDQRPLGYPASSVIHALTGQPVAGVTVHEPLHQRQAVNGVLSVAHQQLRLLSCIEVGPHFVFSTLF